jgi:hypothetical protein
MKIFLYLMLFLVLAFCYLSPSYAGCRWDWVCDNSGLNCRQVPLCDNAFDVVPPRPPEVRPIVPPSVAPIEVPTVPPPGASRCRQVRVCSMSGCNLQTVCY